MQTYYSDLGCAPGRGCCPACSGGLGSFSDSVGTLGVVVGGLLLAYFVFRKKK